MTDDQLAQWADGLSPQAWDVFDPTAWAIISGAGFPDFWNNIDDIIGGAADLVAKIGALFKDLSDLVWNKIGGALRWVDAHLSGVVSWFFDTAADAWGYFRGGIAGGIRWLSRRVGEELLFYVHSASDLAGNFVGGIFGGIRAVRSWLDFVRRWTWEEGSDAWGFFAGGIAGGFRAVRSWIDLSQNWLWDQIDSVVSSLVDTVTNGIGWLWDQTSAGFGAIFSRIDDFGLWLKANLFDGPLSVVGMVGGQLGDLGSGIVEGIKSLLAPLISGIADLPGNLWSALGIGAGGLGGALTDFAQLLGGALTSGARALWETIFEPFVDLFNRKLSIPGKMAAGQYPSFGAFLADLMDPPPALLKGLATIPLAIILVLVSAVAQFSPVLAPYNFRWAQDSHVGARDRLLTADVVMDARLRAINVSSGWHDHLARQGYRDEDIAALIDLSQRLPGPSDLVRMGVREVFTPEIAERFGQFQDLPGAFTQHMTRIGYTDEWSRNFWAAHWDLPSTTQGFEMLHRGVIDEADLNLLLRALDVMPYWRDKLTQISYNPLGRVDVRRVFKAGVVQRDKVLEVYRSLGYSPEDAEILTKWVEKTYAPGGDKDTELRAATLATVRAAYARRLITRDAAFERLREDMDYEPDDAELILAIWDFDFFLDPSQRSKLDPQGLSRSIIEQAYERGLIDANRASAELEELAYTPEDAALILQLVDYKQQQELADLEADVHIAEYRGGFITEAELAARLGDLDIPQKRIDLLVQREIIRAQAKPARLSTAQLIRGFRGGLLSEAELRTRLSSAGYADTDIDVLLIEQAVSLGVGQLQAAVRAGRLSEADFRARLAERGFAPVDIDLLLPVVKPKLSVSHLQAAVRAGQLAEADFRARLAAAGFAPADIDLLLPVTERQLTVGQLQASLRAGQLTEADFRTRAASLGFTAADVALLVPRVTRELTVGQLSKAFKKEIMSETELRGDLTRLGFTSTAVDILVSIA